MNTLTVSTEAPNRKSFWGTIFVISIMWLIIGLGIGYMKGRSDTRELAKEKFVNAISWALSEELLVVNSNKLSELKASGLIR
jgi:hypothetical protein